MFSYQSLLKPHHTLLVCVWILHEPVVHFKYDMEMTGSFYDIVDVPTFPQQALIQCACQ